MIATLHVLCGSSSALVTQMQGVVTPTVPESSEAAQESAPHTHIDSNENAAVVGITGMQSTLQGAVVDTMAPDVTGASQATGAGAKKKLKRLRRV